MRVVIRCCDACRVSYEARSSSSRFCSARCRQWSHRNPGAAVLNLAGPQDRPASLVRAAVLADLTAVGRDGSFLGAVALGLAEQIDGATGQGVSPLVKELRAAMTAALGDAYASPADPLDELRARRDHVKTPTKRRGSRP